jgi:transposase
VLSQLVADRAMPVVCAQPLVTSWSRQSEDLTCDKTDDKDAVLIARIFAVTGQEPGDQHIPVLSVPRR